MHVNERLQSISYLRLLLFQGRFKGSGGSDAPVCEDAWRLQQEAFASRRAEESQEEETQEEATSVLAQPLLSYATNFNVPCKC